jgi:hypothetical protein
LPIYKQVMNVKIRTSPFEMTTTNKIKRNSANTKEI